MKDDVKFLADRLALALLLHRELFRGIIVLPSRAEDRDELRQEREYQGCVNIVRNVLERDQKRRKHDAMPKGKEIQETAEA